MTECLWEKKPCLSLLGLRETQGPIVAVKVSVSSHCPVSLYIPTWVPSHHRGDTHNSFSLGWNSL